MTGKEWMTTMRRIALFLLSVWMLLYCISSAAESVNENDRFFDPYQSKTDQEETVPAEDDENKNSEAYNSNNVLFESGDPGKEEPAVSIDPENLIYNGGFELLDEDGLPEGWYPDEYYIGNDVTEFTTPEDMESDRSRVAEIWNKSENDARFYQVVPVEPDTIYCLSGYIWADRIEGGHGANLSIEDTTTFSRQVYDTDGNWEYIEYYGKTGPEQDLLTVFIRVGGYGGVSTGKARFDQIRMTEINGEPPVSFIADWDSSDAYYDNEYISYDDSDEVSNFKYANVESSENSRLFLILAGIGWICIFLMIAAYFKGNAGTRIPNRSKERFYFVPILLIAFLGRLIISYHVQGYMVDVSCFTSWGGTMDIYGPLKFYEKTSYCDYPPLYTYILSLNSVIARWGDASEAWTRVIFRFIPSLCDVLSCYLLYCYARERMPEQIHRSCVILVLFSLNPAVILNSAAWGQIDSVLCLLILIVALFAMKGKWHIALPVYAISILLKPQALMLGILGLVFVIMTWIMKKESRKSIVIGVLVAFAAMAVIVLPFSLLQENGIGWLIDKYKETLSSYAYATVNAANFNYLLGGNWEKIGLPANVAASYILAVACLVYALWWYYKNKKKPYGWIESILGCDFSFLFIILAVMRLSWEIVGTASMVFAFVITISMAIRKKDIHFLPYLGALLFILLYVFGIKMHERYIFPALFLLCAAWIAQRDRRYLYLLGIMSLTLFINEGIVLDNSIRFGATYGHLLSNTVVIADILSILNIFAAVYAVYIGCSIVGDTEKIINQYSEPLTLAEIVPQKRSPLDYRPESRLLWKRKDWIILSAITVVYSLISLTTLGSTKAPQSGWVSDANGDEIIFDLGDSHQPAAILYFGRVCDSYYSDFTFSESNDLVQWSEDTFAQMNQGECWKWKYVVSSYESENKRIYNQYQSGIQYFTGRYIKLTARQKGLRLNEIIFRDSSGHILPAEICRKPNAAADAALNSEPEKLLDEQDTLEALPDLVDGQNGDNKGAQPSWWNSTYFDEIYHARTGYEFLHPDEIIHQPGYQAEPYENSHPPLGKLLMSASIALLGMTPFGWRFAGALAGILMIPGMYLLGKQLTKKTSIAALVALLISLDCMHLTQTQIATIDSFPVLFIIFSYFFMLRYIQTDIIREPIRKSLIPLLFSGIFMGLSIASKWIGIYAGAGLAILFIWHGCRMIRMNRQAKEAVESTYTPQQEKDRLSRVIPSGQNDPFPVIPRLFTICHWCVLFFIIIPVGIYLLSYIPFMAARDDIRSFGDYLKAVWNSQVNMFNYHSKPGLGMDHPFYSPWYEWPLIIKPMYYAARQYLSPGTTVPFSIFSFGNIIIWWLSIPAMFYCILRWLKEHFYRVKPGYDLPVSGKKLFSPHMGIPVHLAAKTYDNRIAFVMIALLAEYLPWVLVPRGTYIYHYFASVPFMILFIGLAFDKQPESRKTGLWIAGLLLVLMALAAFIIFFPYASGLAVSPGWLDIGKKVLNIYY